jgi:hypothetical protein
MVDAGPVGVIRMTVSGRSLPQVSTRHTEEI